MITVGIKYCGGCNPRYDRSRMVKKLIQDYPEISFIYDTAVYCPLWITVSGCPVACGSNAPLPAGDIFHISSSGDFSLLRPKLRTLLEEKIVSEKRICTPGDSVSLNRTFSQADIDTFTRLTGDANAVHTPSETAARSLFHRPIVPGVLVGSLLSALMGSQLPGSGTILLEEQANYRHPVMPGDVVTATIHFREYTEYKNFYIGIFDGTCSAGSAEPAVTAVYRQMMSKRFFIVKN